MEKTTITKEFTFDAAHWLEDYPGPCANLHGHTYRLQVTVTRQAMMNQDMVMDFSDLGALVRDLIISRVDHKCLNEVLGYAPTAENMVREFARTIEGGLPPGIYLSAVRLWETPTSFAEHWV
jgi:6-pyruvoyltetrahydropterin/6-carboxytetrahydropterin synthase